MSKNENPKSSKPTGQLGFVALPARDGERSYQAITWPNSKPDIERCILESALGAAAAAGLDLYELTQEPEQNPEQDYDFTLRTPRGREYLDLMEIVPQPWTRGPHDQAPSAYRVGDFADAIYQELIIKAKHYGGPSYALHLLLYVTDWRLRPGPSLFGLLSHLCKEGAHGFRTIFYYCPDDERHGQLIKIFPQETSTFDAARARRIVTFQADLSKAKVEGNRFMTRPFAPLNEPNHTEGQE